MRWLIALYVFVAWLLAVAAWRRRDTAGIVEAALWPLILVFAHVGVAFDAMRARVRAGRAL